jgi:hypothetical protein
MAKKFVDTNVNIEKTAYLLGDGTALTLTNKVRVLFDDTLESAELYTILTRIRDRLLEGDVPDAP